MPLKRVSLPIPMPIKHSGQGPSDLSIEIPAELYNRVRTLASTRYERVETLVPKLLEEWIRRCKELDGEA